MSVSPSIVPVPPKASWFQVSNRKEEPLPVAAPWVHAALIAWSLLPLIIPVNTNINVIVTATITVYIGCRRSVKPTPPEESMTQKDAMKFPLIGSAVLFGLFLMFKFLPKDLVNKILTGYFVLLGTLALTTTFAPAAEQAMPRRLRTRMYGVSGIRIPYVMKEATSLELTAPEVIAGIASVVFCVWYLMYKHWVANNGLGLAFAIQGIEHLSLGAVSTGVILLSGLFLYDIFWVFCTPVMVSVAKSFDAPIKLLFLRGGAATDDAMPFSMLGLGDIVIPGVFVALLLRYDHNNSHKSAYFLSTFGGYILGLVATIVVMNWFEAAQPALLYIVPAILGSVGLHAASRHEFNQVLHYSEAKEEIDDSSGVEADKGGKGASEVKKLK